MENEQGFQSKAPIFQTGTKISKMPIHKNVYRITNIDLLKIEYLKINQEAHLIQLTKSHNNNISNTNNRFIGLYRVLRNGIFIRLKCFSAYLLIY